MPKKGGQEVWALETVLISMLLEQEKELVGLKSKLEGQASEISESERELETRAKESRLG